ncbi:TIGR00730 family Rossman fold protein [Halopseudomonas sp.]|uniref:LOG family protein n=1 Tax=Halopseudomonas sp. TaxID=2901191 RepID=UPI003564A9F7
MTDNQDPADYLTRHVQTGGAGLQQKIDELVAASAGDSKNSALYREMILHVVRMAQADGDRWDAKIMLQTIAELEQSFARLEMFKRRRKVTVFGSARTHVDHQLYALARDLGKTLAENDFMAITGAGNGIMGAAHEGAGLDNSLGFNITLPFEQRSNDIVYNTDHDLRFRFFFLRKLFFVKEADALVLCPGGFGTLDETLEVITLIQTGKSPVVPVILLDVPNGGYWDGLLAFFKTQLCDQGYILEADFNLMTLARSPDQAMQEILGFYSNYHSSRWMDGRYILRMQKALTETALERVNEHFSDICKEGSFVQTSHHPVDPEEPELEGLHRLEFSFNGRHQGRLRALIDFVNQAENLQNPDSA